MRGTVRYPWHYILNGDGVEELYDLATDPGESRSRTGDLLVSDTLADLRAEVERIIGEGR